MIVPWNHPSISVLSGVEALGSFLSPKENITILKELQVPVGEGTEGDRLNCLLGIARISTSCRSWAEYSF